MMKKFLVAFLLLISVFGASAKFRWGPSASVNFSDYNWKQDLVRTDMRTGFNVGVMGELMIPGIGFGIDMALRYSYRGACVNFNDQPIWNDHGTGKTNLYLHTLQVPVNLRFKWTRMDGLENIFAPLVYGGPVFNFNLGHSKCDAVDVPAGSVGLQVGGGVELFKRYQITGGYMWDMTYDVQTKKLDNFNARLNGGFISVAVLF